MISTYKRIMLRYCWGVWGILLYEENINPECKGFHWFHLSIISFTPLSITLVIETLLSLDPLATRVGGLTGIFFRVLQSMFADFKWLSSAAAALYRWLIFYKRLSNVHFRKAELFQSFKDLVNISKNLSEHLLLTITSLI